MPTWNSAAAFEREVARFQAELDSEVKRTATREMAEHGQRIAEREASHDLGGDPMMSGWPQARLDTKIKPIRDGAVLMPDGPLAAAGWTTVSIGRNVGETGAFLGPGALRGGGAVRRRKDGTVAKQRGRKAKRWNGITRGKGTASRAVEQMEREAEPIAERHVRKALVKRFDVS